MDTVLDVRWDLWDQRVKADVHKCQDFLSGATVPRDNGWPWWDPQSSVRFVDIGVVVEGLGCRVCQ